MMIPNIPPVPEDMNCKSYVLTVAAGKRMIAKGIAAMSEVVECVEKGTLVITKGTTNAYVVEEILGVPIDKTQYVIGRTTPPGSDVGRQFSASMPDVIIQNGRRLEGVSYTDVLGDLQSGDIILKGANAINYEMDQVGLLIGHPTGGTLGAVVGTCVARRIRLIHPVGLEKSTCEDLVALANLVADIPHVGKGSPSLWVSPGELFTEIEAVRILCGADAYCLAAGGVGGAEGAVWLLVVGAVEQIEAFDEVYAEVAEEPALV